MGGRTFLVWILLAFALVISLQIGALLVICLR